MSLFSIYAGLIYNDLFSKGVIFKESGWGYVPYSEEQLSANPVLMVEPKDYGEVYPYGVDPAWKVKAYAPATTLRENNRGTLLFNTLHVLYADADKLVRSMNILLASRI